MVGEVFFSGELLPAVGALVGSFTGVQSVPEEEKEKRRYQRWVR